MKRLSLQWRITLMTAALIGVTCVLMNCLIGYSGKRYMDAIGSGISAYSEIESGAPDAFDPQSKQPDDELTIIISGAQAAFGVTNWYITAAVTLIGGVLAYFVSGRALRPLRSFAAQVESIQPGNLAQCKVSEDVLPEFQRFSRSFNGMIDRLDAGFTAQRQFTGNAAHELRTPLTRLQLGTALLRRRSGESKELERIETEAHRLDSMINDLLVMSRNQAKNALVSETVKANQLWNEVLDNAAFEAEQMGKSFTVEYPPGPWPLYGNPNALESALENIVRNALRYSHTKISVSFSVDKDGITVNVDDDGPGVSPEDREQIFRPFYRTDEARDRESGGTGLGLAIVETAIQQHRGWVKADDSPLGGLRLTIWLPLYKRT